MRPSPEEFEKWNETHALNHDLDKFYYHPNRIFRYIENKRINVLLQFAEIHENDKVLEAGCGAGHILERIDKGKLTGIDIADIQVKRSKARLGSKAEIIKASAENLPFENESFDKIICTEVFEHVLDPIKALKEMHRVLKNNGLISLSIPNEKLIIFTKKLLIGTGFRRVLEPKKSGWDLASKNNLEEWHIHNYSLGLIVKQVNDHFKINFIKRIPFYFLPYRYVLQLSKLN